ncbi:pilus assembly protein [Phenylobacterium sp.]|uniref:TadE/TadG family type IV pilus assembly protein n=1 Tax=Phenylobacterium sp. TaxID=1871053 RepID=UPI0028125204|nr:pilus assembly protein [Phenylobacterium sp.]
MRLRTFWRDRRGASAVEFGLLLPLFVMLILGGISVSQLMFAVNSLHFAVEEAARCGAINTTACGTLLATETYARERYSGPNVAAQFDATDAACGRRVTVSGQYRLEAGVATWNVPLSAESCFAAPLAS